MSTDVGDDDQLKVAKAVSVAVACVVIDPATALDDLWSLDRFIALNVYDVLSRTYVQVFEDEHEYLGWRRVRNVARTS